MAKVKYGNEIKTEADLQNLITGLIFRSKSYTLTDMVNLVARYSKGAEIVLSEQKLISMVEDTLDLFQREDLVSCENGQYTTTEITHIQLSGEDMFAKHKDENKVNAYSNEEDILSK